MKLKLDENLGTRCQELLRAAGHDVMTVADQQMTSVSDSVLIAACATEGRALVTLDLDFSNPLLFPPHKYAGIAVLRLPAKPTFNHVVRAMETLVAALQRETLTGRLWSVEIARIRIYQPPDA